jgi:hypothetical protein
MRSSGVLESNAMMIFLDELHGFLGMCTCMRRRRRFSFPPILILSTFSFLLNARWIPDGQLCPTVTNRANYIHWIEDLLASCPAPWHQNGEHEEVVCGIDVGTGANCIYPLLGTALHKWHFVATGFSSNEFHHVLSVLWIFRACAFASSTVQISTCGKCLLLWKSYVCMHVSALIAEVHIAKYCK